MEAFSLDINDTKNINNKDLFYSNIRAYIYIFRTWIKIKHE